MHHLCRTDYLWQRKFFDEFQYRPSKALLRLVLAGGRGDGGDDEGHGEWKRIYEAMNRVEVYTWGSNTDFRLGYGRTVKRPYESVPKRVRRLEGIGIVQLAPTGWGCHALDKNGNVWAWGRIMESNRVRPDAMPRMLKRPKNVVRLAAGRQVVLALDGNGQVWQWCRENKAVEITFAVQHADWGQSTLINHPSRSGTSGSLENNSINMTKDPVVRISAGWDICAALTKSGRLYAWRPPQSADGQSQYRIHVEYSVSLKEQGRIGYEVSVMDGDQFKEVAAGSDYVVAVTTMGKVYIFRQLGSPYFHHNPSSMMQEQQHNLDMEDDTQDRIVMKSTVENSTQDRVVEIRSRILGEGLYLPIFTEALAQTVTMTYEEQDQWERKKRHQRQHGRQNSSWHLVSSRAGSDCETCEERFYYNSMRSRRPVTVSANFENFALHHSSGKVILGRMDVKVHTLPTVVERLHSNVTHVAFGDYHQGMLTEDGVLRTWGSFAEGALGQGDLRIKCVAPTVIEGPLQNKVVIAVAMAGWQSACLAIDVSRNKGLSPYSSCSSSNSRAYVSNKDKGTAVDDGYCSLENASSSGSGCSSGSSSEGTDSSDGEEQGTQDYNDRSNIIHSSVGVSNGVGTRSGAAKQQYLYGSSRNGKVDAGGSVMTLTRLDPVLTVYEPLSSSCFIEEP
ncbi:hypothetical protein EDD11_004976 [Mortierella claussenii]|nr:hypothetical protein EDD11_004976 [Mortierella claussenii]